MKKLLKALCCGAMIASIATASGIVAKAGSSELTVAGTNSISQGIDSGTWFVTGKVKGENGKILFDDDVRANGKIVAAAKIQDYSEYGLDTVFNASYTLTVNDIPTEESNRFTVFYGMNNFEDKIGSAGTTEVYFVKDGADLKVGVAKYDAESGDKIDVVLPTKKPALEFGTQFTLKVSLAADGYLTVTVLPAGQTKPQVVCDDGTPKNGDYVTSGYTGIAQSGKCKAEVLAVNIKAFRYDNAETPLEIVENFDNGHYNRNAFFTRAESMDGYSGACYVDNGALKFDVLQSFISTVYRYSNFEMTFDIVDVQREDVYDEKGNIIKPKVDKNAWFGVSFGSEENKGSFDNHARGATLLTLTPATGLIDYYAQQLNHEKRLSYPKEYVTEDMQILSLKNQGKIYNFKVSLIDGKLTMKYKLSTDADYPATYLVNMDLGFTPYGSVSLLAYYFSGYTFDNLRIVNKDYAPVAVELKYEENGMASMKDFSYTDTWQNGDLISEKVGKTYGGKDGGCSSAVDGLIGLPLVLAALITVKKRGKKDE